MTHTLHPEIEAIMKEFESNTIWAVNHGTRAVLLEDIEPILKKHMPQPIENEPLSPYIKNLHNNKRKYDTIGLMCVEKYGIPESLSRLGISMKEYEDRVIEYIEGEKEDNAPLPEKCIKCKQRYQRRDNEKREWIDISHEEFMMSVICQPNKYPGTSTTITVEEELKQSTPIENQEVVKLYNEYSKGYSAGLQRARDVLDDMLS